MPGGVPGLRTDRVMGRSDEPADAHESIRLGVADHWVSGRGRFTKGCEDLVTGPQV